MQCASCGTMNLIESRFCSHCGTQLQQYINIAVPKKSPNHWVKTAGLFFLGFILRILRLRFLTTLFSWIASKLGLGKGNKILKYYNEIHAPIFAKEQEYFADLTVNLLENDQPDFSSVYQKAFYWKNGFHTVRNQYMRVTENIPTFLIDMHQLEIQRVAVLETAMDTLIFMLQQQNYQIQGSDFMNLIYEYYRLYDQWDNTRRAMGEQYNVHIFEQKNV